MAFHYTLDFSLHCSQVLFSVGDTTVGLRDVMRVVKEVPPPYTVSQCVITNKYFVGI
jgi:hypothetical protein